MHKPYMVVFAYGKFVPATQMLRVEKKGCVLMDNWKKKYQIEIPTSFTCDFTTNNKAGNTEYHIHDRVEIYLLIEGSVQYFVENTCYILSAGDLIIVSDNEIHKVLNQTTSNFTRLVMHLDSKLIKHLSSPDTDLMKCFDRVPGTENLVILSSTEREEIIHHAKQLSSFMKETTVYGNDLHIKMELMNILIAVNIAWERTELTHMKPSMPSHRVQDIVNYIEKHLTEPMTLDSIAQDLSLNKYYLSHVFKKYTQDSLGNYILIKRIALAKQLLKKGHTVTETCELAGFNDYSNFIRSFRKITGYTPKKYQSSK